MSIPAVDFAQSIQKQRLNYKAGGFGVNLFFSWFLALTIIFCGCIPFIDKHMHPTILSTCITVVIIIWMIANLVLMNALLKVPGTDIDNNRKNMVAAFNEVYDDLKMNDEGQVIIRSIKYSNNNTKYYYSKREKVITILLDNKDVYLNITSLFRGDLPSPVNGWYNYLKCQQLARIFLSKQAGL